MKTLKLITALLLSVVMLGACTAEQDLTGGLKEGRGNVRFKLGGAATQTGLTRTAAENNEKAIDNVLVLLWDTDDASKYSVLEAKPTGVPGEYDVNIERDARYCAIFVANADAKTRENLENLERLEPGFHEYTDYVNLIRKVVSEQAPDGEYFLMSTPVGKYVFFTVSIAAGTIDVGTVNLERRSARFDIVNKADGITIDKVTYNNRTIHTALFPELNNAWSAEDSWYDNKTYEDLNLKGSSDEEATDNKLLHSIYSYRNYSTAENGKLPTLTIEYTEDETGVKRTHDVQFIDPAAPANTPLMIKANNLYTITLTKAEKLEFNVSVSDWEEGDEINASDLSVNDLYSISAEEQQRLNDALWVNRFAHYYVKSIDPSTKEVEFYDHFTNDLNDYPLEQNRVYYSRTYLLSSGLLTAELTDKASNDMYRVPTAGEVCLLYPYRGSTFDPNFKPEQYINGNGELADIAQLISMGRQKHVSVDDDNPATRIHWTENISFKNNADYTPYVPTDKDDADLHAEIEAVRGTKATLWGYIDNNQNILDTPGTPVSLFPAYAIRFKGTDQYSAYKWETKTDPATNRIYASIKIKAIPKDLDVSVYEIANNDRYWENGYIEYKLPLTSRVISGKRADPAPWVTGAVLTSSKCLSSANPIIGMMMATSITFQDRSYTAGYPLLLIKTETGTEAN